MLQGLLDEDFDEYTLEGYVYDSEYDKYNWSEIEVSEVGSLRITAISSKEEET